MPEGSHTFGKYQLLDRIAAGGMAEIFRARYEPAPGVTKQVVIKRILPHYAENKAFIGMFTQMLAVRHFGNNYHYVMHVLSGLQRSCGVPLCIGSAITMAEAKRWFPDFSKSDLKGPEVQ